MITMTGSGAALLIIALGALFALALHSGAHSSD
jgi:hypothetical protein